MAENNPFGRNARRDALDIRDATRDIQRFMKALGTDMTGINRDFSRISREADNFATYQANAVKNTKNVNKLLEKANDLLGSANKQQIESSKYATEYAKILRKIEDLKRDDQKRFKKLTDAEKEQINQLKAKAENLRQQSEALNASVDNSRALATQFEDLGKKSGDLSRNIFGGLANLSDFLGISDNLTDGFKDANEIQRQKQIILEDELELQGRIQAAYDDYLKDLDKEEKKLASINKFKQDGEGMTAERLKRFGLEGVTEGTSGRTAAGRIQGAEQGMANTRSGLGSTLTPILKGIGTMLKSLAKSLIVLKAMSFVADMISYAFTGVEGEAVSLARSMNMGRDAGFQMRADINKMQKDMKILGTNTADLVKFQVEFTKHTGTTARLNADQLETAMLMTKQMGLSNDQAIELIENFKASGMGAREGLDALRASYNQLYDSNQTAMSFNQLMEDITSNTELQYIFQTQGADAAMRNANAVRRTGLSLAQQRSMAEGTLDFEKTMSDQLELQLLTGKDINLQRAQTLALQGRNGEAVAEIQKEMGKLTAEQRKSPIIMNKMLSILGMSREEYYEMLNAQRLQAKLEAAQAKAKEKFNREDFEFGQKYYDMLEEKGKQNVQSAIRFAYSKSEAEGERVEKEIAAIEERMKREGEAHATEEEQLALRKKAFDEFHRTSLHNAKVRHGVAAGEIKTLESQLTASEAFNEAMNELKQLLADLVGEGALQYFSDTLIDFVTRAKQVGFGSALLGFGDSAEDIADANAARMENFERRRNKRGGIKLTEESTAEDIRRMLAVDLGNDAKGRLDEAVLDKIAATTSKETLAEAFSMLSDTQRAKTISSVGGGITSIDAYLASKAEKTDDFILRPGQPLVKFNKGDLVMGGTQLGMGGGKIERLLEELLAETKAGKVIKMDTVTVANSLRRNAIKMNT